MKKALTLSIIIPVYNEEQYLEACLEAIKRQTEQPDEVIIVDNNSTDSSIKIAQKYKFVKVISEKKQGTLYGRTTGLDAARSDVLGRIDADTRLEPNWVKTAKRIFQDRTVAAVTGSSHFYDMPLSPQNHWVEDFFKHTLYKHEKNFPFLFGTNMAIRRSVWRIIKPVLCSDNTMYEDADMAIHLYKQGYKIVYDSSLRVGMSARRYSDGPLAFHRYNRQQSETYKKHGISTIGSAFARVAYATGYIVFRPLALAYDQERGGFSVQKLLKDRNKARVHPFDATN